MKGLLPVLRKRLSRPRPAIVPLCPQEEANLAELRARRAEAELKRRAELEAELDRQTTLARLQKDLRDG